ncbi:copper oxidase [Tardiphaga sp. vice352]|uniref:multicopper oxidase family protein n=1 Tax=unclassified Tardiphaga TaxID=2631404 RepID=UPI00116318FB|nr:MULTISPECIES: multicopper oxidase domain-containing protein [unclassified Tardiphaga]QDM16870.1 copper oxidase [Tardiphaga sp. vice278]QDM21851.1 copper oxidase [Tardiphaga sp. vice154]QDM27106.1 copper oxidase [Tardiphaga sp. vice304]QDM32211.1 copper oxidase [Tardiphaga sp. vice352]
MTHAPPALSRRTLLAGLGGTILVPSLASWTPSPAAAQGRPSLALRAGAGTLALAPGTPTPAWLLSGADEILRFKQGDEIDISLQNDLPVPIALMWRGLGGIARAEPLLGRPPMAAGGKDAFRLPLRHAGTGLLDARLLGDGQALPSPARACVVQEAAPPEVDRDEVWLIEDFRLRADGTAIAPGSDPKDAATLFTINGKPTLDLAARINERLRIRIINGCQRSVIALRIEDQEIRVMAIDGQPAEPFLARNSQLVLAPGTRIDAFIDITKPAGTTSGLMLHDGKQARTIGKLVVSGEAPARDRALPPPAPLPSNGLPARLDLKSAQRIDLTIGGAAAAKPEWVKPAGITASAPAFRVKPGRVVVLALTNRDNTAAVFHLHGHPFRLLDRLDDGWKPYWLDTLAMQPNQTHRIAFAAEYPGRWGMEAFATDWAAPRLMRSFEVA